MAAALARGWSAAETGPDQHASSATSTPSARGRWRSETGGRAAGSNRELAETADVLVLATKPAALARSPRRCA